MEAGKYLIIGLIFSCCVLLALAASEDVPSHPCSQYGDYFSSSHNPSRTAAQAHQESLCNEIAVSPVGAQGIMQFMPKTSEWAADSFCRRFGKKRPFNAYWSINCGIAYMEWFTVDVFDDYCANQRVDEQRYNGGFWVVWELRAADLDWHKAEHEVCGIASLKKGKRTPSSCNENYDYPRRISAHQPLYLYLGGKQC